MGRPLNALYRFLPGISLLFPFAASLCLLSFSLPFAYSPFPRLLFLSLPSSPPPSVTGGVSLRQLLAVFAERSSRSLASFSLGYTEFHARCRLFESRAANRARASTQLRGTVARVLVTTCEQRETGGETSSYDLGESDDRFDRHGIRMSSVRPTALNQISLSLIVSILFFFLTLNFNFPIK